MDTDELRRRLAEVDAEALRRFLLGLYEQVPELESRIETLALRGDPAALKKSLAKRIQSVKRGRRFIDYHASYDLARDLDVLVGDIEQGLLEASPSDAFDLVDRFLVTANKVLNRVDDSGGAVAGVYRDAVLLWLRAASAWGADAGVDWADRIYRLYQGNDYGVFDPLLPNSAMLLTPDQLGQLAWRYESDLRKSMKEGDGADGYHRAALTSRVALGQVAEALEDPALYERSVLISSPQPNEMQKQDIARQYLRFGQPENALRWLAGPWESRFEDDRLSLLDELYTATGDSDALRTIRRQRYERSQDFDSLLRLLEVLPEEEQESVRREAAAEAERGRNVVVSTRLLLQLGEPEAAEALVLSRYDELARAFYEGLIGLGKAFEEAGRALGAAACYRALLLDILESGRSKAYAHAARYYRKLESLAEQIDDYEPLPSREAFFVQLQEEHGRKRSFWSRLTPSP